MNQYNEEKLMKGEHNEFTAHDWLTAKPEFFSLTEEQERELHELAAAFVNRAVELKVPVLAYYMAEQSAKGHGGRTVCNLNGPTRATAELICAATLVRSTMGEIVKSGLINTMHEAKAIRALGVLADLKA